MENEKLLIEIPADGIIRIPIMDGDSTVGERIIDLSHLPTVDAVEVVHGRWVHDKPWLFGFECDQCGKWILPDGTNGDMNYCPNCGAKMDGDKHE